MGKGRGWREASEESRADGLSQEVAQEVDLAHSLPHTHRGPSPEPGSCVLFSLLCSRPLSPLSTFSSSPSFTSFLLFNHSPLYLFSQLV